MLLLASYFVRNCKVICQGRNLIRQRTHAFPNYCHIPIRSFCRASIGENNWPQMQQRPNGQSSVLMLLLLLRDEARESQSSCRWVDWVVRQIIGNWCCFCMLRFHSSSTSSAASPSVAAKKLFGTALLQSKSATISAEDGTERRICKWGGWDGNTLL